MDPYKTFIEVDNPHLKKNAKCGSLFPYASHDDMLKLVPLEAKQERNIVPSSSSYIFSG